MKSIAVLVTSIASLMLSIIFTIVDEIVACVTVSNTAKHSFGFYLKNPVGLSISLRKVLRFALIGTSIIVSFYLLPTVVEWLLLQKANPWIALVVFGDLIGCAFLSLGLNLKRTAVLIYLFATTVEATLYAFHIVSIGWLIWITNLLPTMMILFCIAMRMKLQIRRPVLIR
jgi:hypothetical protein